MEKVIIKAQPRQLTGKKVSALRRQGKLPGVIYGKKQSPTPILMDLRDATKTLSQHSFVTLDLDGQEVSALVQEKQRNFIYGTLLHVDFLAVSLTEKLTTTVSIEPTGTPPAIKNFSAVLVHNLNELEVECLPQDLPEAIIVDVSGLKEIGDSILIKDLPISAGIEILSDPETVVFVIVGVGEEAVEVAVGEEPEVIEKGKLEEEED